MELRCSSNGTVDGVINLLGSSRVGGYIRNNSGQTPLDRRNERGDAGRSITAVDGNYMVDKAGALELERSRQAGADDLKTYFPELNVPSGITWHDLEVAEQMVFDWENGGDYRAFGLAIKIYEYLRAAVLAAG
jgi:hypothetical protein